MNFGLILILILILILGGGDVDWEGQARRDGKGDMNN